MLGDQVYADEDAPRTREFIRRRRPTDREPGEEVADFEEYARLYHEAWGEEEIRWLLSVVPSAMLFDDHDVHDDWNTSISWLEEMRSKPWWDRRITGALASYWVYQHLGNLSPGQLSRLDLLDEVRSQADAGPLLHDWGRQADWGSEGRRWSYCRDLPGIRLVVLDSREGRVLAERPRRMFDDDEWRWLEGKVTGGVRHLLIADTLPIFLPPAIQWLESWNDAVAAGAWSPLMRGFGERVRRGLDLEHWGAFPHSFEQMLELIRSVGSGARGEPPASIVTLGGDVHHAYLASVRFPEDEGVISPVWQAVCSPFRNALKARERHVARFGDTPVARAVTRTLARSAGSGGLTSTGASSSRRPSTTSSRPSTSTVSEPRCASSESSPGTGADRGWRHRSNESCRPSAPERRRSPGQARGRCYCPRCLLTPKTIGVVKEEWVRSPRMDARLWPGRGRVARLFSLTAVLFAAMATVVLVPSLASARPCGRLRRRDACGTEQDEVRLQHLHRNDRRR